MYDQGHARKYHMLCTHTLSGSPLISPFHPITWRIRQDNSGPDEPTNSKNDVRTILLKLVLEQPGKAIEKLVTYLANQISAHRSGPSYTHQ